MNDDCMYEKLKARSRRVCFYTCFYTCFYIKIKVFLFKTTILMPTK